MVITRSHLVLKLHRSPATRLENLTYFHVFCHIYVEKRTEEIDSCQKHGLCRNLVFQ